MRISVNGDNYRRRRRSDPARRSFGQPIQLLEPTLPDAPASRRSSTCQTVRLIAARWQVLAQLTGAVLTAKGCATPRNMSPRCPGTRAWITMMR